MARYFEGRGFVVFRTLQARELGLSIFRFFSGSAHAVKPGRPYGHRDITREALTRSPGRLGRWDRTLALGSGLQLPAAGLTRRRVGSQRLDHARKERRP